MSTAIPPSLLRPPPRFRAGTKLLAHRKRCLTGLSISTIIGGCYGQEQQSSSPQAAAPTTAQIAPTPLRLPAPPDAAATDTAASPLPTWRESPGLTLPPHLVGSGRFAHRGGRPGARAPEAARPTPPERRSRIDWNVPTNTPVRTGPSDFTAWTTSSPTDLLFYAVDNYDPSTITAPGITAATAPASIANWASLTATQQREAEESTVFVLTNLYTSKPTLLGWSNSETTSYTNDSFGLSYLLANYEPTNIEFYALSQAGRLFCWNAPSPASSAGYAASEVGPLTSCSGWSSAGEVGSGAPSTTSSAAGLWVNANADIFEIYWGDDSGQLNCLHTGEGGPDAGAGVAPSPCSSFYVGGSLSLGTAEPLGEAVAFPVTQSPGTSVESVVFVGGQYGTMYVIDDVQEPTASITISMFCSSTGTAGAACPATNGSDYAIYSGVQGVYLDYTGQDWIYWVSHGVLYQAPWIGSGPGGALATSDVTSVTLYTPAQGPSFTLPSIDPVFNYGYVAANDHIYEFPLPFSSGSPISSTPLSRRTPSQSLIISPTAIVDVPAGAPPEDWPLAWYDSVFVPAGSATSNGVEQYGCTGSASNPILSGVTSTSYGTIETGLLIDYQNGNLNFGYDTGGSHPTGGFVQYPAADLPAAPPLNAGWQCPASSVATAGAACGAVGCSCPAPTSLCSGACVDTQTDPENCGGCDALCAGTCTNGQCAAGVVTTLVTSGAPECLAVDATDVYWTDDSQSDFPSLGGAILKEPIGGGVAPTTLTTGGEPFAIAIDATTVYWTDVASGAVMSLPKSGGGTATTLASSAGDSPAFLTVNAKNVYWTDSAGFVESVAIAGGAATTLVTSPVGGSPAGIAVDSTHVYWADSGLGTVNSVPIGGGAAKTLASDSATSTSDMPGTPYALAIDTTSVYWTDDTLGVVMSAPLEGTSAPATLATELSVPLGIAVDATSVYIADNETGVGRVPLQGGQVTTLASGFPNDVVVDATSVYLDRRDIGDEAEPEVTRP